MSDDRYPTRRGYTDHSPRLDPVVWSTGPGPLAPRQLADYTRDGFIELPDLIDADMVRACRAEIDAMIAAHTGHVDPRAVLEPDSDDIRSIFEIHRTSRLFAELIGSPRLVGLARQVLGSDVYVHQSRVNLKRPFGGAGFHWHTDFEPWHAEDGMPAPRALSFSIALDENSGMNGPLMIIPGSHHTYIPCAGATPGSHHEQYLRVHRPEVGVVDDDSVAVMAQEHGIREIFSPAGSAVMFDSNCVHGSNGNISPFRRANIFIVYNSVENALVEPFAAEVRRPAHLASRDFTAV